MIPFTNNHFFFGVVEDVHDPEERGRCKVRIVGVHSEDTNMVSTEDLPWAEVSQPSNNPWLAGRGTSPNGLMVGSCVGGIFADPDDMQQPIVFFAYGGNRVDGGDTGSGAFGAMGTALYSDDNNSGVVSADDDFTTEDHDNGSIVAGDPKWMSFALQELAKGVRQDTHPDRILEYSKSSSVNSRTAAWCASFVCWCIQQAGLRSPNTGMARGLIKNGMLADVGNLHEYQSGEKIPPYGSIIVIPRGKSPSGHTCFSMGTGGNGRVLCLHGNWGYSKHGTGTVIKDNITASTILAVRMPVAAAGSNRSTPPQRNSRDAKKGAPYTSSGAEKKLIEAMTEFGITDPSERRMLWAQCAHETGGFKYMTEIASKHASSKSSYKGRGMIQVTGKANYRALGRYLGVNLLADPSWITRSVDNNIRASLMWWIKPNLGAKCRTYAARGDVDLTSVGVNVNPFGIKRSQVSRVHGLQDRRNWWRKAQSKNI